MKYILYYTLLATAISVVQLTYAGLISKLKTTNTKIDKVFICLCFAFSIAFAVITLHAYVQAQNLF